MGLPVTVYRWDDAGAPNITTMFRSGILNVIKKCLVEGYGSKSPLGWGIAEEIVGERITFSTAGATGFARIGSNSVSSYASMYFLTGSEFTPPSTLSKLGNFKFFQPGSNENAWILIGTSKGFYFQTWRIGANNNAREISLINGQCIWVGEIDSFFAPDPFAMTSVCNNLNSSDTSGTKNESIGASDNGWWANRFYDLDNSGQYAEYKIGHGFVAAAGTDWQKNAGTPESTGVPIMLQDVIIRGGGNPYDLDYYNKTQANSLTRPFVRGKLPGLFRLSCCLFSDQPWPTIYNANGVDYYCVPSEYGVTTMIKLDSWYD
ncbi:hypothetical protein TUM4637_09330 [Shewanella hafniensis]|uniref:hypothetical protein n=1 Tax=Shewanella hafniensis TaxID=365590 RepID=UPI001BBB1168|nr:hypothetical protein [Shewanella hafniensis]MCL1135407.1 hypothetical protein [Shewanella hafniensis]GIU24730.1 hypothetical protein TUM4637_09330 [Shewanella hafniensis]